MSTNFVELARSHARDIILPSGFCPAFFALQFLAPQARHIPISFLTELVYFFFQRGKPAGQAELPALLAFPQSGAEAAALQTLRDCRGAPNFAKRLDCGRFTAAFDSA